MSKKGQYWEHKIKDLFTLEPSANCVEDRYRNIRYLIKGKYQFIQDTEKEQVMEMLKDAISLDRRLRLWNEGNQTELKQKLQDEFIVNELT